MVKTTTFLLVEDDPHDVLLVERAFKETPPHLRLCRAADGCEAVRYLKGEGAYGDRQKYPLPDVILLDLKMPRFNGFEFLAWLRSESPDHQRLLPVIVMSSSALQQDITRAYALGISAYHDQAGGLGRAQGADQVAGHFLGRARRDTSRPWR
jgi:CheY-like chemotaxis protein